MGGRQGKEFMARTPLSPLPPVPTDRDRVEEAGVARFGPQFVTGENVVLGPVHEVDLQFNGYANGRAFIDFDTGHVLQYREGIGNGGKRADFSRAYAGWIREAGVDARNSGNVEGFDLQLWLIDNGRWDSLQNEIRSGHPLNFGREADDSLVPFGRDVYDPKENEIGTFLFITREGGRGVMQVFPRQTDGSAAHRDPLPDVGRERPAGTGAAGHEKIGTDADWESERLVILKARRGRAFLLNLETGQRLTPPDALVPENLALGESFSQTKELAAWCRANGALLGSKTSRMRSTADRKNGDPKITLALVGLDTTAICVLPGSFEEMTVPELKDIVARRAERGSPAHMLVRDDPRRDTYIIVTKSGRSGILQIEAIGEDHSSIAFRYRLIKSPSRQN